MRVMSDHHDGASRAMRRPHISSSQKSVKTPRRRRKTPKKKIAPAALRNLRRPQQSVADSVRAELSRRHDEEHPELLAEIVLGVKAAASRDLPHAHVAVLEQARRLLQSLLFEEVTEEPSGNAVEASGDVLTRIAELFRDCLDRHFFVGAQ